MHDATLTKIAIITSISGMLLLYIALETGQPIAATPSAILQGSTGSDVLVKGYINAITKHGNTTVIQVTATESAGIVLFRKPLFNLTNHMSIEARGTITEHNGTKEMIAEEVRVV